MRGTSRLGYYSIELVSALNTWTYTAKRTNGAQLMSKNKLLMIGCVVKNSTDEVRAIPGGPLDEFIFQNGSFNEN